MVFVFVVWLVLWHLGSSSEIKTLLVNSWGQTRIPPIPCVVPRTGSRRSGRPSIGKHSCRVCKLKALHLWTIEVGWGTGPLEAVRAGSLLTQLYLVLTRRDIKPQSVYSGT